VLGGSVKIYFWLPQSFNPPIAYLSVDQSYRDTFSCTLCEKHVLKPKKIHREMKPVKWSAHGHGSGSEQTRPQRWRWACVTTCGSSVKGRTGHLQAMMKVLTMSPTKISATWRWPLLKKACVPFYMDGGASIGCAISFTYVNDEPWWSGGRATFSLCRRPWGLCLFYSLAGMSRCRQFWNMKRRGMLVEDHG